MVRALIPLGLLLVGLSLPSCLFTDGPPSTVVVEHKQPDNVIIEKENKPPDVNIHVEHKDAPAPAPPAPAPAPPAPAPAPGGGS